MDTNEVCVVLWGMPDKQKKKTKGGVVAACVCDVGGPKGVVTSAAFVCCMYIHVSLGKDRRTAAPERATKASTPYTFHTLVLDLCESVSPLV
jgi:hypothetical protein